MVNRVYPDAPRVAVGAVILHQDKVLLVLRGQAPAKGLWAIPGGSVELGETLQVAAEREVMEETGLKVQAGKVIHTFDAIQRDDSGRVKYHYVIVDLLAEALDPSWPLPGPSPMRRETIRSESQDLGVSSISVEILLGWRRAFLLQPRCVRFAMRV